MVNPVAQSRPDAAARIDGAATRGAILEATLRRLVSDGYARLNLRDIAQEAGVNHALINYHFGSKQQLVLAVLDAANRRLLDRQQRMYEAPATAADKWREACTFYEDDLRSGFVRLMMELMAASFTDAALRREFVPRLLAWHRLIDEAVAETIARHRLELPVSARAIGAWIACFWIGMEAEMTVGIDEADGHYREALQAMHALLAMLEVGAASGAPPAERPRAPAPVRGRRSTTGRARRPHGP
jgi:AcrR family transcriptional regulator